VLFRGHASSSSDMSGSFFNFVFDTGCLRVCGGWLVVLRGPAGMFGTYENGDKWLSEKER
jgi:hypothetical protein